jgi:rubredoxin
MKNRIREVNRVHFGRIQIGRLHCPICFSSDVYSDLNDVCACRDCYSKSDFKELLNKEQVRERKIINILS